MATVSGILTTAGANYVLTNGFPAALWMAIGTDDTTPAASDTALGGEQARASVASVSISGNVVTLGTLFAPTAAENQTIKEAGIFSAVSGGTMLFRATYGVGYAKGTKQFLSTFTGTLT